MRIYTEAEVKEFIRGPGTCEEDNYGQLIVYTGMFRWQDGSYRDEQDPSLGEEESKDEDEEG